MPRRRAVVRVADVSADGSLAARTLRLRKVAEPKPADALAARALPRRKLAAPRRDASPGATLAARILPRRCRVAAKAVGRALRVVGASVVRALFARKKAGEAAIVRAAEIAAGKGATARSEPNHRHSRVSH